MASNIEKEIYAEVNARKKSIRQVKALPKSSPRTRSVKRVSNPDDDEGLSLDEIAVMIAKSKFPNPVVRELFMQIANAFEAEDLSHRI